MSYTTIFDNGTKLCSVCQLIKPISDFYSNSKRYREWYHYRFQPWSWRLYFQAIFFAWSYITSKSCDSSYYKQHWKELFRTNLFRNVGYWYNKKESHHWWRRNISDQKRIWNTTPFTAKPRKSFLQRRHSFQDMEWWSLCIRSHHWCKYHSFEKENR